MNALAASGVPGRGNDSGNARIGRSVAPPRSGPYVAHAMPPTPESPKVTAPQDVIPRDAARFRRTLARVMAVQLITLLLLWLLQQRYGG